MHVRIKQTNLDCLFTVMYAAYITKLCIIAYTGLYCFCQLSVGRKIHHPPLNLCILLSLSYVYADRYLQFKISKVRLDTNLYMQTSKYFNKVKTKWAKQTCTGAAARTWIQNHRLCSQTVLLLVSAIFKTGQVKINLKTSARGSSVPHKLLMYWSL